MVCEWKRQKSDVDRRILSLQRKVATLESEIEGILMERIVDKANAERYDRMIAKREDYITAAKEQLGTYTDMEAATRRKKLKAQSSIDLLDELIANGSITESHLRMIVDKILISESDGELDLEICLKAAFRTHFAIYDGFGNVVDGGVAMDIGGTVPDDGRDDYEDA